MIIEKYSETYITQTSGTAQQQLLKCADHKNMAQNRNITVLTLSSCSFVHRKNPCSRCHCHTTMSLECIGRWHIQTDQLYNLHVHLNTNKNSQFTVLGTVMFFTTVCFIRKIATIVVAIAQPVPQNAFSRTWTAYFSFCFVAFNIVN